MRERCTLFFTSKYILGMEYEPPPSSLPLLRVRVLDIATLIAGPMCARLLADFGADVIKVERPGMGDPLRAFQFQKDDVSLWWKTVSRNKRPITLDLKAEKGKEILLQLVEQTDVLVENFRPGTIERLGLGPDVLYSRNPGLILLRNTAFGQDGPYSDQPGFGTLAEALSGYAQISGHPDRPPLLPPIALCDELSGIVGAFAVMTALYHRDVNGAQGQIIDLALYESLFSVLGPLPTVWQQNREMQERSGSRIPFTSPRNAYETSDGKYVALSGSSPTVAARIFAAIDRPDLNDDPRFATNEGRCRHADEVDSAIVAWISQHTLAETLARFHEHEAAIAPIHDMEGIFSDPHYRARHTIVHVPDEELGDIAMQNVFPRFSATPGKIRHAGLPMGAATREVLQELGYNDDQIDEFTEKGVT